MFCMRCGQAIPDNSKICPLCGADLERDDQQAVVYASQKEIESISSDNPNKKKMSKNMLLILSGVAVLSVIIMVVFGIQKNNLKK